MQRDAQDIHRHGGMGHPRSPPNPTLRNSRVASNKQQDRKPRLVRVDLQSNRNSSRVSCQTLYSWPGRGITPALSDGGEPLLALPVLAGLQHIARASLEEGQGQSLEVVQQKLPTSERILHTSRRTTLAKATPSCSSRTCPSGICRSQGQTDVARRVADSRSSA